MNYNPNVMGLEQYVVKQGDSLYMIGKKYGVSVDELKSTNHLVSNMIYPNQILFIPNKIVNYTKSNDSVQDIINRYSLTLKDINQLKVIPNQEIHRNHEHKCHIVKKGDTIENILAMYQLSPLEFLKLNEDELLELGKKIIIEK